MHEEKNDPFGLGRMMGFRDRIRGVGRTGNLLGKCIEGQSAEAAAHGLQTGTAGQGRGELMAGFHDEILFYLTRMNTNIREWPRIVPIRDIQFHSFPFGFHVQFERWLLNKSKFGGAEEYLDKRGDGFLLGFVSFVHELVDVTFAHFDILGISFADENPLVELVEDIVQLLAFIAEILANGFRHFPHKRRIHHKEGLSWNSGVGSFAGNQVRVGMAKNGK